MEYTEKLMDHFNNPRNVGELPTDDPDVGTGMVGSPACGDMMQMQIRVKDGVIEDIKFKTFGCGAAIASSSLATEWMKGKTLLEALKLNNKKLAEELKLPPIKIHCSVLATQAIHAALSDYNKKQEEAGKNSAATDADEPSGD